MTVRRAALVAVPAGLCDVHTTRCSNSLSVNSTRLFQRLCLLRLVMFRLVYLVLGALNFNEVLCLFSVTESYMHGMCFFLAPTVTGCPG